MTGKEKIIERLVLAGLVPSNPSTRSVANAIVRMYGNGVDYYVEESRHLEPEHIRDLTRSKIERALGVIWEKDIEPILRVIGFDEDDEMDIILERWEP